MSLAGVSADVIKFVTRALEATAVVLIFLWYSHLIGNINNVKKTRCESMRKDQGTCVSALTTLKKFEHEIK